MRPLLVKASWGSVSAPLQQALAHRHGKVKTQNMDTGMPGFIPKPKPPNPKRSRPPNGETKRFDEEQEGNEASRSDKQDE